MLAFKYPIWGIFDNLKRKCYIIAYDHYEW